MGALSIGDAIRSEFPTDDSHSAVSYGNPGVDVVATPALVGLIEVACHRLMIPHLKTGEASVGVHVDLTHLAAAPVGVTVAVEAAIVSLDDRRVTFEATAEAEGFVLMRGRHVRARVDFARLRRTLAERFPGCL